MIKKLILLFYTLRYLKLIQLVWRIYLKINQLYPFSTVVEEPVKCRQLHLITPVAKHTSYIDGTFCFLNETAEVALPINWNQQQMSKLWLYNLHYFDYINQLGVKQSFVLELMDDWLANNPVGKGNGWEAYTLSLRIVNWIKFLSLSGLQTSQLHRFYKSLTLQSRYLFQHLEYHLLGNHLFENGVALMFAGAFFEGEEAETWLHKGLQIVLQQTEEQVLNDGGHFERSSMYHVLILEDILDCLNLHQTASLFSDDEERYLKSKAEDMLNFLAVILHQDGDIPFFNDSALQITPSPDAIYKYADSLGIKYSNNTDMPDQLVCIEKPDFGLLMLQNQMSKMIVDVGQIGPNYLPGHAHCDSLSFELSILGRRCIVNSGTYQYAGAERNNFRATAAHNTVKIDAVEQHEIWSTFRVARRGRTSTVRVERLSNDLIQASASFAAFKSRHPVHRRKIEYQHKQIAIVDSIDGTGEYLVESFIHLHPQVKIIQHLGITLECKLDDVLFSIHAMNDAMIDVEKSWYSPEFGIKNENHVLVLRKQVKSPSSLGYKISF